LLFQTALRIAEENGQVSVEMSSYLHDRPSEASIS